MTRHVPQRAPLESLLTFARGDAERTDRALAELLRLDAPEHDDDRPPVDGECDAVRPWRAWE